MMAVRQGDWKLMVGVAGKEKDFIGLYNLADDIGEKNNLAEKHPEKVVGMKKAMEAWYEEVTKNSTPQRNQAAPSP